MTSLPLHQQPSPNFGDRRGVSEADMVVIHYTAMETAEAACARLCDPEFEVSAHYLIAKDGRVIQMVDEAKRAWHAGAGQWGDVTDVNSHSIGIELDNTGQMPFPSPQMNALEELLAGILERHSIPAERVIGHSDMAPHRKIDPGARFDWRRLALQGLSIWPELQPHGKNIAPDQQQLSLWLHSFGYPEAAEASAVLDAFRDRFRAGHRGPLDETDMAMAQALAIGFPAKTPVDQAPTSA